jgi:hypothetical protein
MRWAAASSRVKDRGGALIEKLYNQVGRAAGIEDCRGRDMVKVTR